VRPLRLAAAAALALGLGGAGAAQAQIAFGPPQDVPVFSIPVDMAPLNGAIAVLARDPVPLVAITSLTGTTRAVALAAGSVPEAMAAGDLDGDGRDEIVVVSSATNNVSVIKDQTPVPPPTDTYAGQSPNSVVVGDFTGDHHADVAVVGFTGVTLLRGDGTGALAPAQLVWPEGGNRGSQAIAADFNGDGRLDIAAQVIGHCQGPFFVQNVANPRVLYGDGAGGFPTSQDLQPGCTPAAWLFPRMAVRDLNGDRRPDIAVASAYEGPPDDQPGSATAEVKVALSTADGFADPALLGPAGPRVPTLGPYPAIGVAGADLDNDGQPDLIAPRGVFGGAGTFDPPALAVFRNLGGGAFAPLQEVPVPAPTGLIVPMDVDGDGALDLVLGRGSALGTIAVEKAVPVPAGQGRDFGDQQVGTAGPGANLTVENQGVAPLSVSTVALSGPAAADFAILTDACSGRTLRGGERCVLQARFRPTAPGRREAAIDVAGAGLAQPLHLALSGNGVAVSPPAPAPTGPPTARTGCAVRTRAGTPTVSCGVVLSRSGSGITVALRLLRDRRTWARADATHGGRLPLRPLRRLLAGRYTLVVIVREDGTSRQTRRALTIAAPTTRGA